LQASFHIIYHAKKTEQVSTEEEEVEEGGGGGGEKKEKKNNSLSVSHTSVTSRSCTNLSA
jgi:hypothetical protein